MKKKKRISLCTKIIIFCFVVTAISVTLWIMLYKLNTKIGNDSLIAMTNTLETNYFMEPKKENVSILFAGVDKDKLRTDTIIYAKYDTINNMLYMMSIPRDAYTDNPLATYKINSIYYGGKYTKEFIEEVQNMLDVKIDYYAVVNLDTISQVINKIGGLEITLDEEIWKLNKKTGEWYFVFPKGTQILNAEQVEVLVRNRDYEAGDISRGKMQRKVITALIKNIVSTKNILKISDIATVIIENINTNVTVREVMKYLDEIKEINLQDVVSVNMPIIDMSYNVNGVSCVIVDKEKAKRIISQEWIYNHTYSIQNVQ